MQKEKLNKQGLCGGEAPLSEGFGEALISDEVHEIISYRPHWIIRKGNTIFFMIVLLLLSLTWVIHYPDVIHASARLEAINGPKLVVAKTEGKLEKLLVANNRQVTEGQYLAYLQSTGNHGQVLQLKMWIENIIEQTQNNDLNKLINYPLPTLLKLGELQTSYQEFENVLIETKQILSSGYYQQKKAALQKDLVYLSTLKKNAKGQKLLVQQDQGLQQKEYEAYESLARDKVIAPLELNQYKSKLLSKEQGIEQIAAQLTSADLASHNKSKELLDLQKYVSDQHQKFHSALLVLKSGIEEWIKKFIVVAPEAGAVQYASSLQEKQLIAAGQNLFYIVPAKTIIYSELLAGQKGLGKIKIGQKVILKVAGYPSNEFGYVDGTVNYISSIPNERDSFLIKVALPNELRTNYDKVLFYRNGLSASAEIITDNRRLFDRLIGELKNAFQK